MMSGARAPFRGLPAEGQLCHGGLVPGRPLLPPVEHPMNLTRGKRMSERRSRLAFMQLDRWPAWLVGILLALLMGPLAVVASGRVELGTQWRSASRDSTGQAPDPAVERGRRGAGLRRAHRALARRLRHPFLDRRQALGRAGIHDLPGPRLACLSRRAARWTCVAGSRRTAAGSASSRRCWGSAAAPASTRSSTGSRPRSPTIRGPIATGSGRAPTATPSSPTSPARCRNCASTFPRPRSARTSSARAQFFAPTPSGTGWQFSAYGLLGASLAWEEGVELNLLGLSVGHRRQRPGAAPAGDRFGRRRRATAPPGTTPQANGVHLARCWPRTATALSMNRTPRAPSSTPGIVGVQRIRRARRPALRRMSRGDAEVDVGEGLDEGLGVPGGQAAGAAGRLAEPGRAARQQRRGPSIGACTSRFGSSWRHSSVPVLPNTRSRRSFSQPAAICDASSTPARAALEAQQHAGVVVEAAARHEGGEVGAEALQLQARHGCRPGSRHASRCRPSRRPGRCAPGRSASRPACCPLASRWVASQPWWYSTTTLRTVADGAGAHHRRAPARTIGIAACSCR